jgi:hypothetical protein
MKLNRRIATATAGVLALAASLLLAAAASAHDRNHDRLPDRWERAHHLSLRVNQARRDQDHDGLNNRGEFRAHMNPRKADTDGDGIEDGDENAGTVASFTGGVLTISLAGGGTLGGEVTDETEIECDDVAHASDDGDDDQGGDDGDHHHHGDDDNCAPDALTAGAAVHEADLKARDGKAIFEKVELGA